MNRQARPAASVANDPKATSITRKAFDWTIGQAALPHDRHSCAVVHLPLILVAGAS
jgi:hypothetical protein